MKITSQEIKQHEFEKSFRGYSIEEVDDFLDNLALEWERISNESKMLKMQLEIAEKETLKLREVEMTLIKTLRTAEDTSTKITESAQLTAKQKIEDTELQAQKTLQDADIQSQRILADANNKAQQIIDEAEQKAKDISNSAKLEFGDLESKYATLEAKRNAMLAQLKNIVESGGEILDKNKIFTLEAPVKTEETSPVIEKPFVIEKNIANDNDSNEMLIANAVEEENNKTAQLEIIETDEELNFSSAVNAISLEPNDDKTNLEVIEGIGPKIKEVLNKANIVTFRDLATTPVYRIKDILEAAGPHFAIHDPSTWVEQALLAESGNWEQLASLKDYLVAGRKPASGTASNKADNNESSDEMLEKVNKVKAAIRKSMVEKPEEIIEPRPEPKTVNEFIAEQKQSGSFFDSLN